MLQLRPAIVVECDSPGAAPADGPRAPVPREQRLLLALGEDDRAPCAALADVGLVGPAEAGDRVIVAVQAPPGPHLVHVNLTRGLAGAGTRGGFAKLAGTTLQHSVVPVDEARLEVPLGRPAAVLARHGQLGALAWAFSRAAPQARLGYVQCGAGTLAGARSGAVATLRARGLLAGHLTAGAAYGGEAEALTLGAGMHHGVRALGWDAVVCGPGPGACGSGAALEAAHAALALGCPTLLVADMSASGQRARSRGIGAETISVLDLLLEPVTVALPAGMRSPVGTDLRASLGAMFGAARDRHRETEIGTARPARITRHDWRRAEVDLPAFAAAGIAPEGPGSLAADPLYHAAALAAGGVLAQLLHGSERVQELESA